MRGKMEIVAKEGQTTFRVMFPLIKKLDTERV